MSKQPEPQTTNRQDLINKMMHSGMSAFKALEIAIDYERGNLHAKNWVEVINSREVAERKNHAKQ